MSRPSDIWFNRKLHKGEVKGTLGKLNTDGSVQYDTGDGRTWFTSEVGTVMAVISDLPQTRTNVIVKQTEDGFWEVAGVQKGKLWQATGSSMSEATVPRHNHNTTGATPWSVPTRNFHDGLVYQDDANPALTLTVTPFNYKDASGNDQLYPGGTINLLSPDTRPVTPGTQHLTKIGFSPTIAALVTASTPDVSPLSTLGRADAATLPFTDEIPLSAVVLTFAQVTSPVESDFIDARIFLQSGIGGGGSGSFPKRATMWHDEALAISGNTLNTTHIDTGQLYNADIYQNPPSSTDKFTNGFFIAAGTYTFWVLGETGSDHAKIDWYIDGTIAVTGQDWYAASSLRNVLQSASVTVASDGWHKLEGRVNGHNASSTNYYLEFTKYFMQPSSD